MIIELKFNFQNSLAKNENVQFLNKVKFSLDHDIGKNCLLPGVLTYQSCHERAKLLENIIFDTNLLF